MIQLKGLEGINPASRALPPVEKWNPPNCGDIGMEIARDGSWKYRGSPIGRMRLVRLFSTILRHDADGYYLVTPVEKVPVAVADVPFLAVAMEAAGQGRAQTLTFTTNVGDRACAGPDHPLRCVIAPETGAPAPYVHVRARLEARIARAVFYDLVALGVEEKHRGSRHFGVWSAGRFFPLAPAGELTA